MLDRVRPRYVGPQILVWPETGYEAEDEEEEEEEEDNHHAMSMSISPPPPPPPPPALTQTKAWHKKPRSKKSRE